MTDSPLFQVFVRSALVPAILVGVALFLTGGMKEMTRSRLQGLIFALGFVLGAYFLLGRLSFPPHDATDAFSWGALLLAAFVFWHPKPLGTRYLLRGVMVFLLGATLLWSIRQGLSPLHYRNMVAFFCLALGVWSITERSAGGVKPFTAFLLPLISLVAVSVLLAIKGSASFSQMAAILSALIGAVAVLSLVFPDRVSVKALIPYVSVFVIMFMAAGLFFLGINPWWLIFMALPYLFLWIRGWLTFIPNQPLIEGLILGVMSAAPLIYFLNTLLN